MGVPPLQMNSWFSGTPRNPGILGDHQNPVAPGNPETPGNPVAPGNSELLTSSTDYLQDEDLLQDENALIILGAWCHALGTTILNKIKETNADIDDSTQMRFGIGFMIMYLCFSIKEKAVAVETDPGVQFTPFIDTVD